MESNLEMVDTLLANDELNTSDRLEQLERKVSVQSDELTCLKSALADCIRRIQLLESKPTASPAPAAPSKISPKSVPLAVKARSEKRLSLTPSTARLSQANSSTRSSSNSLNEGHTSPSMVLKLRGRSVKLYAQTEHLADSVGAPDASLRLEWVYGYRGKDCRSNIFLLSTGELVYFIASVAVLYNPEENNQRFYLGHTDDIKCLSVHPNGVHCATGQTAGHNKKDSRPHVRIWDAINLTTLKVIGSEFQSSISCLSFSKVNGDVLAVVDDGNDKFLSLWQWETGLKLASTKCYSDAVLNCEFHPLEKNLLFTSGKQHLFYWTFDGALLHKKTAVFEPASNTLIQNSESTKNAKLEKPKFVLCMSFDSRGDLITGDSDGNLIVWSHKEARMVRIVKKLSDTGIFTINVKDDCLIYAGKSNKIVELDSNYQLTGRSLELGENCGGCRCILYLNKNMVIVGTMKNSLYEANLGEFNFSKCLISSHCDEIWGLSKGKNASSFLTCANDGFLSLWDSMSFGQVWSVGLQDRLHCVDSHPSLDLAAVGFSKPKWIVFDLIERKTIYMQSEGSEQIEVIKYSPNGCYLAAGSRDNNIYVYRVSDNGLRYSRIGKCSAHSSFVTHLDWSSNCEYLMSNSGDYEILFWRAETCRQVVDVQVIRDVEWASRNCVLSMETVGIWDNGSDGTDINACCESKRAQLLVSVDDFGKVNLFKYPCSSVKAGRKVYGGHSSHVTNCRFINNETRLITTGGNDMALFQWEILND
ncbi:echinoderm microtubule-associated -like 1 isoform X5 [Brachionus plicatilis]|uniref:Echinoderm microtubule-associated-like 1 isoform X5 n=1 Tax=Brachionus plicatilis TaxID=10195 RepID=A0A3M7QHF4_BRAPC|nr:echinoderm microtubule-associated -like 1 isoform X5 [Brachionus plicatilis]